MVVFVAGGGIGRATGLAIGQPSASTEDKPVVNRNTRFRRYRGSLSGGIVVLALALTGCTSNDSPTTTTGSTVPAPATPSPTATLPTNSPSEATVTDTDILITINATTIRGTLQPSAATTSLLSQLPLELSFRDYGGQEKIADLPRPVSLDGMPAGGAAEPGTIGYYAPDQALVLYYKHVDYFTGIIPIGTFTDLEAIQQNSQFRARLTVA